MSLDVVDDVQPVYMPNAPAGWGGGLDWGEITMELALQHYGGVNFGGAPWGSNIHTCDDCQVMWKDDERCWYCGKSNKAAA